MKTLAAVLYETGKPLDLREVEIPALKRGQTLVRIIYSGACHTNLNQMYGLKEPDKHIPRLMGHEGSGIVEDIGEGVTKVKAGDYVVLSWLEGLGIKIKTSKYKWGNRVINSGPVSTFAERAIVAEAHLSPLSTQIPPQIAAFLGCSIPTGGGMILNVLEKYYDRSNPQSLAIFGVGGVGLSALLTAKGKGYHPIFAIDIHQHKLDQAQALGADHVINWEKVNPLNEIKRLTDNLGVDHAVEAAGNTIVMAVAIKSLKRHGAVAIAGNVKKGELLYLDPEELNQGKKILGTWGGDTKLDRDVPIYERMYAEGKLPIERLISREYTLQQINEALEDLRTGDIFRPSIKISDR